MSYPLGSIPLTGSIGTTGSTDTFATHLDYLGYGGMRAVANNTERDAITTDRRAFGMLVFSVTDNTLYVLADLGMGGNSDTLSDNFNWIQFAGGAAGGGGIMLAEVPSPVSDSSTIVFSVAHHPSFLVVNGQVLSEGYDYSLSGSSVTLNVPPETGAVFLSYFSSGTSGGGSGLDWVAISGTTQVMLANVGYIPLSSSLTLFTLPTSPLVGQVIRVAGSGSGGWSIQYSGVQKIIFGNSSTTVGTGSLDSTDMNDCVELLCVSSNNFQVISSIGNLLIN